MLRTAELAGTYQAAWEEWAAEEDGPAWDATAGDGLSR
jgi:hypothetical protein